MMSDRCRDYLLWKSGYVAVKGREPEVICVGDRVFVVQRKFTEIIATHREKERWWLRLVRRGRNGVGIRYPTRTGDVAWSLVYRSTGWNWYCPCWTRTVCVTLALV